MRLDQRLEVLARLERGHREHVRRPELGPVAAGAEHVLDARRSDPDPLRGDAEHARDVVGR